MKTEIVSSETPVCDEALGTCGEALSVRRGARKVLKYLDWHDHVSSRQVLASSHQGVFCASIRNRKVLRLSGLVRGP